MLIKAVIFVQTLAGSLGACSAAALEDPRAVLCLQPWLPLSYLSYGQHSLCSQGTRTTHPPPNTKPWQRWRYSASTVSKEAFSEQGVVPGACWHWGCSWCSPGVPSAQSHHSLPGVMIPAALPAPAHGRRCGQGAVAPQSSACACHLAEATVTAGGEGQKRLLGEQLPAHFWNGNSVYARPYL